MPQKSPQSDSDEEGSANIEDVPLKVRKAAAAHKGEHQEIYYVCIGDAHYLYRTMYRSEFKKFFHSVPLNQTGSEDELVRACVLYPDTFDIDTMIQKDFSVLIDYIVESSGFGSEEALVSGLSLARQEAVQLESEIDSLICSAFPSFTPFDLDKFDFNTIMKLAAMAEHMTQKEIPLDKLQSKLKPGPQKEDRIKQYSGMKLSDVARDMENAPVDFDAENRAIGEFPGVTDARSVR